MQKHPPVGAVVPLRYLRGLYPPVLRESGLPNLPRAERGGTPNLGGVHHLPAAHIIPLLGYTRDGREQNTDDLMLLVPRELELFDFARFWSIRLKDDPITTDYMLFWKKGNTDPDLKRFLEIAEYDPRAIP